MLAGCREGETGEGAEEDLLVGGSSMTGAVEREADCARNFAGRATAEGAAPAPPAAGTRSIGTLGAGKLRGC